MKRKVASRQLVGREMGWWNAIVATTPENAVTWEQFKERFEEKFIPSTQKVELFTKFAFLKQGDKTVTEYVTEFDALSKYGLSFIDTPAKKNDKFVAGLRMRLESILSII